MPLNGVAVIIFSVLGLAIALTITGVAWKRLRTQCLTISGLLGTIILCCFSVCEGNEILYVTRPSKEQVITNPVKWRDYLVENRHDIPAIIIAKSALQAFALAEMEGDMRERYPILRAAEALANAAIPPRLEPWEQQMVDSLKPVAGTFRPTLPATTAATAAAPNPKLDQIAQLRLLAEGN